jgi:hypothetical protein
LSKKERVNTAKSLLKLKKKFHNIINSERYLKSVGKEKICYPWLYDVVTSDGRTINGCFVKNFEKCNCDECDLACYGEVSGVVDLDYEAIQFFREFYGLPIPKSRVIFNIGKSLSFFVLYLKNMIHNLKVLSRIK